MVYIQFFQFSRKLYCNYPLTQKNIHGLVSYFPFDFPKYWLIGNKKKWVPTLTINDINIVLGYLNNNIT